MSHTADVILWTFFDEPKPIARIQAWLKGQKHSTSLGRLLYAHDSIFTPESEYWAGSFNYLDTDAFVAVVFKQKWQFPERVCVSIKNEHDDVPTMYYHPAAGIVDTRPHRVTVRYDGGKTSISTQPLRPTKIVADGINDYLRSPTPPDTVDASRG